MTIRKPQGAALHDRSFISEPHSAVHYLIPPEFHAVKKKLLRHLPHFVRNRYGAGVLVLLFWITFMHDYDLYTTFKLRRELHKMQEQHAWYAQEIQRSKEQLHELGSNNALKEKFARETYLMKRDNEEIFVLVPEK